MSTSTKKLPQTAPSVLDAILIAQFTVGWAGESGEEKRLGWWRTDLVSEFGGEDLFRRLLPRTWEWAVFEAAREAAARLDAELRSQSHDADELITLFSFGFAIDERISDRLHLLKRNGSTPVAALPGLAEVVTGNWNRAGFEDWVKGHGKVATETLPSGRRLRGEIPESLELTVKHLIAGLSPLADEYPMPHYRRSR
jgi:hypothetical protein